MKPELTLTEVNRNLEHLKRFIFDVTICTSNIEQIISSQNDGLFLKPIEGFIGHYVYLSYSNCAINCYKIFKESESWSVFKLFNKLENSKYDQELKNLIKSNGEEFDQGGLIISKVQLLEKVLDIRNKIKSKSSIIKKVNNRRLKVYAHSDREAGKFQPETLVDLKEIRDLAISIFNKINGGLNDVSFMFENVASIGSVLTDRKLVDEQYSRMKKELKVKNN